MSLKRISLMISVFISIIARINRRRNASDEFKKSTIKILWEIYLYIRFWNARYAHEDYFYYNLDKKKKTKTELFEYIPRTVHTKIQGLTRYKEYECLAYDKKYEYLMFSSLSIAHPEVVLMFFNGMVTNGIFQQITVEEAEKLLLKSGCSRFFLKPAFSAGTIGTDVLTFLDGELRQMNGTSTNLKSILQNSRTQPGGCLLQAELLDQHPAMKRLNPDSVNTLRIVTYRCGDVFRIVQAVLRVGRPGKPFDNSLAGGVFIDLDTTSFITREEGYGKKPEVKSIGGYHPDNGIKLSGMEIPFHKEIIELLERITRVYAEHTYLGWDVAITSDGPSLIEVNLGFDIDIHQVAANRGLRDEFGYDVNMPYQQKSRWNEANEFWVNASKNQSNGKGLH